MHNLLSSAQLTLGLSLLLISYWLVDLLLRQNGLRLLLSRLHLKHATSQAILFTLFCALLSAFWTWQTSHELRLFACALTGILAWNASTRDYDPVEQQPRRLARLLLPLASIASYFCPSALLLSALLLSVVMNFWQHHASFPMRVMQALLAFALLQPVTSLIATKWPTAAGVVPSIDSLLLFFLIIQVSHYLITALAKMWLGPKWYSWPLHNRLHHLTASAYSWGWARFFEWGTWLRTIRAVRRVEKPLQFFAFFLELGSIFAFVDWRIALFLSLAFAGFHLGVFALSGLLFWDWIACDLLLAWLIFKSPQPSQAFGLVPLVLAVAVLILFPLRHRLWKPMPLGWFDTPLTARIHWEGVGVSGQVYGIYNNFMCPHERLYGRVNACFFVPHPVVTYHLGEVWKAELRDAIVKAGPCASELKKVRDEYGILPQCAERQKKHIEYLQAFFAHLNAGAVKQVLPSWLKFLKAPGDQIFYWGKLPAFKRQEKLQRIRLRFVEEYFQDDRLFTLHDEVVQEVIIPETIPSVQSSEPTPTQLDNFLLQHAVGRLLELPGAKAKYTKSLSEA